MKKYLDDKTIETANDDKFGHLNLANEIYNIIQEQNGEIPINIGLFGKWGVGKSSVVELLEKEILAKEISEKKLKFIRVNVWKYQSVTSIRNKIFYQIAKELGLEKEVKSIYENSTTSSNKIEYGGLMNTLFGEDRSERILVALKYVFTMSICALFVRTFFPDVFKNTVLLSTVSSLIVTLGLVKIVLENYFKTLITTTTSHSKPFESEEQFEHATIDLFNRDESKAVKKILFIDDLDRCASNKVLHTLETIKTFLSISNCIFIVACDHDIIRKAVVDSNKEYNYSDKDGAHYLEKFFQHFIFVPPYLPANLREYTKKLVTSADLTIGSDLREKLDTVIYILAYRDIISPRKIKVLLNSFIFDYYSILEKEKDSKNAIQSGLITNFPERLAILTVLKIDYPQFITDLITDPTLASKLAYRHYDIESETFRKRYDLNAPDRAEFIVQLQNYLTLVKDWVPRDFTPYLFVAVESSELAEFSATESAKLLTMIRNGDLALLDSIGNMATDKQAKICNFIGHLQESLSNIVERRNATHLLTHYAQTYPDTLPFITSRETLYAFRLNYEQLFLNDDNISKLNPQGLCKLIVHIYNQGYRDQGKAVMTLAHDKSPNSGGYFSSLLYFLDLDVYRTINTDLEEDLIHEIKLAIDEQFTASNFVDQLKLISSSTGNGEAFDRYLTHLMKKVAQFVADEYDIMKISDTESKYKPEDIISFLSEMEARSAFTLIKTLLDDIFLRDSALFKLILGQALPIISKNEELSRYVSSVDLEFIEEIDEDQVINITKLAKPYAVEVLEEQTHIHPIRIKLCLKAVSYLNSCDSSELNTVLVELIKETTQDHQIATGLKREFLCKIISAFKLVTYADASLIFCLNVASSNRHLNLDQTISERFWHSLQSAKSFGNIEEFLLYYSSMVNIEKVPFDKANLKKIIQLHVDQDYSNTLKLLHNMLKKMRRPIDLVYLCNLIEQNKNHKNFEFCLLLFLPELTYTKATTKKIKLLLPTLFTETVVGKTSGRTLPAYSANLRGRMLELLVLHTDFDFGGNALDFIVPHFNTIIKSMTWKPALCKLHELIVITNKPGDMQNFDKIKICLEQLCFLAIRSGKTTYYATFWYMANTIDKIIRDNRSTKKSELNSIFKVLIDEFKGHTIAIEAREYQLLISNINKALTFNLKLKSRTEKLLEIFTMKQATTAA